MNQTDTQTQQSHSQSTSRVAQFKDDVAAMKLRDPRASRDRMLGIAGAALMAVGIALGVLAYFTSSGASSAFNTQGPAEQRDAIVIGLLGVTFALVGGAMFLRYSLAQFFRFWLARLIYEQQTATDRIVETQTR